MVGVGIMYLGSIRESRETDNVDPVAFRLEKAIRQVQDSGDESTLIEVLLEGELHWEFGNEPDDLKAISYDWQDVLDEMGFERADAPVELRQIRPFGNWPHGIFIVRFGTNRFFTQSRGMTTPLRKILRVLREKVRSVEQHPTWEEGHLLFLCHNETRYFQFARFTEQKGGSKISKLQMFGWGPHDHIRTVCEYNLKNLIYRPEMTIDQVTNGIEAAFDVSKVSKAFYSDYETVFNKVKESMMIISSIDDEVEIHQSAQTLFNRLFFLRFIEKKGWIIFGDSPNYLQELFRAGGIEGARFYQSRLLPLFFEGLTTPGGKKTKEYGEVPFLNGILFKESPSDSNIVDLPDDIIDLIIGDEGLFYTYNFTVMEETPLDVDVAIDPEMLGTMFERLVTGRHDKGAYYTPKEVVSFMCKESISRHLSEMEFLTENELEKFIVEGIRPAARVDDLSKALKEMKIIDPACGSGAYLVGFLHELMRLEDILHPDLDLDGLARAKRDFVSLCIFGVDIDEYAIQIARLRLWLSLAVEEIEAKPLPNIDLNFVTADSVFGPNPTLPTITFDREVAKEIGELRSRCIYLWGEDLEQHRNELYEKMADLTEKMGVQRPNSIIYNISFAEVFDEGRGGFDVVITNPPYVRQEQISKGDKAVGRGVYGDCVTGKSDLYVYFYARAGQLLRNGGTSCFICSNTWMDVEFGAPLQKHFLTEYDNIQIIDTRRERQFASAEINTLVTIMTKSTSQESKPVRFTMLEGDFEQSLLDEDLRSEKEVSKEKLKKIGAGNNNQYIGSKWSLILRAPPLYHQLIEHHKDKFRKVSQICRNTQRNNMRVLPKGFQVLSECAGTHADRRPFLHSFKDAAGIRLDLSAQKSVSHARVGRAMASGKFRRADIISNRFYGERIFFIEGGDFFVNDSFFIGQLHDQRKLRNTIIALNSTLSLLFVELRGRKGQGGGVLTFYGPEFTGHRVIDPSLLDGIDDSVYESLVTRDILDVYGECGFDKSLPFREQVPNPPRDRKAIDDHVFDILGLDEDERKEVYWTLCESVQNRNIKSKSV